jgi:hypothetical protein
MTAYQASAWSDFAVGTLGGAATLVGLLFVAVSINLQRILEVKGLSARAGQTLLFFSTPLFTSLLIVVPGQPVTVLGWELIGLALASGLVNLQVLASGRSEGEPLVGWIVNRTGPAGAITVCLAAAGATLLARSEGGLYWCVPAVGFSILAGIVNAWVLLVEILR